SRRRHTRSKRDWSSDVCSSDLVQARFVEDPPRAVAFADALLADVMKARGYPVSDFEQRAGDISVDHPNVVEHYRAGHDIALRHEIGRASCRERGDGSVSGGYSR